MRTVKKCKRCGFEGDVFQMSAHDCVVKYPLLTQKALEGLWFVFGNYGPKHTPDNHKFIQRHVEGKSHEAKFYKPTGECRRAVKRLLQGSASPG